MGEIQQAYILPHPPVIIPEIGKGKEADASATIEAYKLVGKKIAELAPQVIILITPHGPSYGDYIYITPGQKLHGRLNDFGAPELNFEFNADAELTNKIIEAAKIKGIEAGGLGSSENKLDHGALIPLFYIAQNYKDFSLIRISIAEFSFEQLYIFGYCIQKAVEQTDKKAVIIGSGDLSHKLSENGPYGYRTEGSIFDQLVIEAIKDADFKKLIEMDENIYNQAGECGLRSIIMLGGALNGYYTKTNILSYEKPFGVGYLLAELSIDGTDLSKDLISFYECKKKSAIEATRKAEDAYVSLARITVEQYVKKGRVVEIPDYLPEEMLDRKAGVFVTIKKFGNLRGCIGTISPVTNCIANEIIQNSLSAATRDPRFNPIKDFELVDLIYNVDILNEPELINSIDELDVTRYGVIVSSGYRRGLLLPNIDGVDDPLQQIEISLAKAGINKDENYSIERFQVTRHS